MNTKLPPKHCKNCGHAVVLRIPDDGDTKVRAVCPACATIHYNNPLNVVGTVPYWGERVLLCKRNIEPRFGKWTLPAGFLELEETTAQGAWRETHEEAGAHIDMGSLYSLLNVVQAGQIHFFYLARLLNTEFNPGTETQEARLFSESEIPWDEIAFKTVRTTLECFFSDLRRGQFGFHTLDIGY